MNLQQKYDKQALSIEEAAVELGVEETDVETIIEQGELKTKKLGEKLIIPMVSLERYLGEPDQGHGTNLRIKVRDYLDRNLLSFYPKASNRTKLCYITAGHTIVALIGGLYLDELTREILQNALDSLVHYSQSKIDKVRLVMRKMVEIAVDDGLIQKDVSKKIISPKSKQVDNRTEEERVYLQGLLAEILTYAKNEEDPQLFTVLTLLTFTGIRTEELRGLLKTDITFKKKELKVHQAATFEAELTAHKAISVKPGPRQHVIGPTKSKDGDRKFYLGDALMYVIVRWLNYLKMNRPIQYKSKYLFPNSTGGIIRDDVLNTKFTRFKKRHGIDKECSLYRFRHTFCTNLLHNKVDIKTVQKLMGDATVDVILKIYAHVMADDAKEASKEIDQAYVKMLPDVFK